MVSSGKFPVSKLYQFRKKGCACRSVPRNRLREVVLTLRMQKQRSVCTGRHRTAAAMKEENIRKYALLMNELDLTALEVTEGDTVVRLERGGSAPAAAAGVPAVPVPAAQVSPSQHESAAPADLVSVRSPMVGVFYTASSENSERFVNVGSRVKKGDTLCIIEAMKLMNEIKAEEDGIIAEICAANGQIVDFGCDLFRIKREI